jgi:hypothetical protein
MELNIERIKYKERVKIMMIGMQMMLMKLMKLMKEKKINGERNLILVKLNQEILEKLMNYQLKN